MHGIASRHRSQKGPNGSLGVARQMVAVVVCIRLCFVRSWMPANGTKSSACKAYLMRVRRSSFPTSSRLRRFTGSTGKIVSHSLKQINFDLYCRIRVAVPRVLSPRRRMGGAVRGHICQHSGRAYHSKMRCLMVYAFIGYGPAQLD